MGKRRWGCLLVFSLGWVPPAGAQKTPDQMQLWRQPTLVHLTSGYQGQWQWQQRTWTTVATTQGTGVLVHPNGQILTLATVVQATAQGEAFGKQLLLEDLARQRLTLYNEAFPQQKIPLTPANIREAALRIQPEAQLEQFERFNEAFLSGGRADQSYGFRVAKYDPRRNLALVTVQLTQTPTLVLGMVVPPSAGTTIYALAQPNPEVTPTPTRYTGTWNGQGMAFPNPQGIAGGIVFLVSGDILGLAAPQGNQVTLIPTTTLNEFLQTAGVENQDSPVNALWQEGLAHFWQAHYRHAQPVLQAVLNRYPQHHSAQTLLTQAQERITQGQDRSPVAWWQVGLVVGGVGILILGTGAVGLAIWLNRRPRRVPPVQGIPTPPSPESLTIPLAGLDATAPVTPATIPLAENPPLDPIEAPPTRMMVPPPLEPEPPTRIAIPEPETRILTPPPLPTPPVPAPATEEFRPSRLECIAGPAEGESFTLVGSHYLGRDHQRCQIVIPDSQVSGQHAGIEVTETHVTLRDCGSTNGTFINSVLHPRITEIRLQDQDVIILGQKATVKFRFHA
ncbi:hypothetical protein GlitD10_2630 [Gloeomargarita lithophora Alchichica-D10]|uniref:FHA domain-containing protein n=1 Tax=Gloeomargarita lithophora Alchichica-D10 TaxID=1188229 RepID=A0A1J0AGF7_9CYAN|nr:FHA domain-containing protein [Gloeomargarita lithophora]APB34971.1 hypothetical protein GlitD10_2630 [Gloeomargarita lithophora Alchichica-D10]